MNGRLGSRRQAGLTYADLLDVRIAYLDGAAHTCGSAARAREPLPVASVTLGGAVLGAIAGAILLTLLCVAVERAGDRTCFLFAGLLRTPFDAAVGAVWGSSRSLRLFEARESISSTMRPAVEFDSTTKTVTTPAHTIAIRMPKRLTF